MAIAMRLLECARALSLGKTWRVTKQTAQINAVAMAHAMLRSEIASVNLCGLKAKTVRSAAVFMIVLGELPFKIQIVYTFFV